MADYVRIFDTTLRDGEQSPGATMTSAEKLEVARALSRLGVDIMEAGFPAASPDDWQAVHVIAESVGQKPVEGRPSDTLPTICGLARATKGDIDKAWSAVQVAANPRIHTFLATSPIHREHKLRMSKEQIVAKVREMVAYAAGLCPDIEFSPEDAGRTEPEFLHEVLQAAIEAGAKTLNIPDTVGYTTPDEFGAMIKGICDHVADIGKAVISVHCHDDLGLATANTLAGLRAGARQAEVTINGIGERAGNTSLEEVVMSLQTRSRFMAMETGIDATQLTRVSRLVSTCTGIVVQPNKAIVGANAFAHEAGIHQDGMLKNNETYEIMRPEAVGAAKTLLVLGKHSGRHAFGVRLQELGFPLEGEQLDTAFARFKQLAERRKQVTDADIEALVTSDVYEPRDIFSLKQLQVTCGAGIPTATVRLRGPEGDVSVSAEVGNGPVDAAYKAIDQIVKAGGELVEFSVRSVTEGIDALGEVTVRVRASVDGAPANPQRETSDTRVFRGHGADGDIFGREREGLSRGAQSRACRARCKGRADRPSR